MNELNYLDKSTVMQADGTNEKNKIADRVNPLFYRRRFSHRIQPGK